MKNLKTKIKNFFERKRRYSFDKEALIYRRERMLSNTTILLFSTVALLVLIVVLQNKQTHKHKDIAMKHYETVQELKAEISEKNYEIGETNLYTEIGLAVLEKKTVKCNEQNICDYIDYLAEIGVIWYPEVYKSCCKIESGFGQSEVARKYNNLFGMDHPTVRKTLSLYASGRFATFQNWKCSVLDRVLWDYATFKTVPTKEQYYDKIETKYNTESPEYRNKLVSCATKFKK